MQHFNLFFQKQFKGAIYERWLSLLQQFNFEIQYKPAGQIQLPDALSRCPEVAQVLSESPAEEDPFFPFIQENVGPINLPNGSNLSDLLCAKETVNDTGEVKTVLAIVPVEDNSNSDPYDGDTEDTVDNSEGYGKRKKKHKFLSSQTNVRDNSDQATNEIAHVLCKNDLFQKLELDMGIVTNLQKEDQYINPFIVYLTDDKLPESQNEVHRLLLEISDYMLFDGVFYHSRVAKSKRAKLMSPSQLVLSEALVPKVLKLDHDSPLGGHSGINNTIDKIKELFYFPRMRKIITEYVQSCHSCQTRAITNIKTKSKIVPYPTPSQPFQVWQMDLYGPLPPSPSGNIYIFTAIDMFSTLLCALPIRNKDVATVSHAIYSLTTYFGVPQTLISDQGKEFIGKCTKKVCSILGVTFQVS
jgi:hypothetical protein